MEPQIRTVRILASSPSDVLAEVAQLGLIVEELQETLGAERGVTIELVRWETHAVPGAGRPQQVVNESIGDCDIFFGIMWKRFGTPTTRAGSGTEEEFETAYKTWFDGGRPEILFYFSLAPYYIENEAQRRQLGKVLKFRKQHEHMILSWTYDTLEDFSHHARVHLYRTILKILNGRPVNDDDRAFLLRVESDPRNIRRHSVVPVRAY